MNRFFLSIFTALSLATSLASASNPNDNNNNESKEDYQRRIAVANVQDNPQLNIDQVRILKASCRGLLTDEARVALNNIFTNCTYDLAVDLYGRHGDNLMLPLTNQLMGVSYRVIEETLLHASGLKPLYGAATTFIKHFKTLTGMGVGINVVRARMVELLKGAPQEVVGLLRLKPLTDLINKHCIGPNLVAPALAYGVNQADFGAMPQQSMIQPLLTSLENCMPDNQNSGIIDAIELLRKIESLNRYMNECPHIRPGPFVCVMRDAPLVWLNMFGVVDAAHALRPDVQPQLIKQNFNQALSKALTVWEKGLKNEVETITGKIAERTASKSALSSAGSLARRALSRNFNGIIEEGFDIAKNATQQATEEVGREWLNDLAGPLIAQAQRVYNNTQDLYQRSINAIRPLRVIYHTLLYLPMISALNYFMGSPYGKTFLFGFSLVFSLMEEIASTMTLNSQINGSWFPRR